MCPKSTFYQLMHDSSSHSRGRHPPRRPGGGGPGSMGLGPSPRRDRPPNSGFGPLPCRCGRRPFAVPVRGTPCRADGGPVARAGPGRLRGDGGPVAWWRCRPVARCAPEVAAFGPGGPALRRTGRRRSSSRAGASSACRRAEVPPRPSPKLLLSRSRPNAGGGIRWGSVSRFWRAGTRQPGMRSGSRRVATARLPAPSAAATSRTGK